MKRIRLNESNLHRIVKESVNKVLNEIGVNDGYHSQIRESSSDSIRRDGWQERMEQIGQLAKECVELAKDETENGFGERNLYTTSMEILKICQRWGCGY